MAPVVPASVFMSCPTFMFHPGGNATTFYNTHPNTTFFIAGRNSDWLHVRAPCGLKLVYTASYGLFEFQISTFCRGVGI